MQDFPEIYENPREAALERKIMVLSSILEKKIDWQVSTQEKHIQLLLYNLILSYANARPTNLSRPLNQNLEFLFLSMITMLLMEGSQLLQLLMISIHL